MDTEDLVVVVTRYGGHRHLARAADVRGFRFRDRWLTECRFTSAWTLESWAKVPDHPLGLTVAAMAELPECPHCKVRHPDGFDKAVP